MVVQRILCELAAASRTTTGLERKGDLDPEIHVPHNPVLYAYFNPDQVGNLTVFAKFMFYFPTFLR